MAFLPSHEQRVARDHTIAKRKLNARPGEADCAMLLGER
jgi:hypothetical protein